MRIQELAKLAAITTRTLRYYDQIGLLKAKRNQETQQRYYDQRDIDLLQQICLYKTMGLPLKLIQRILTRSNFDATQALQSHLAALKDQKKQLEEQIQTVEKTIQYYKGERKMSNQEKFIGFKNELLAKNEAKYGVEIREKYGNDQVENSNQKMKNQSEEEYKAMQKIEQQFFTAILSAFQKQDLNGKEAKEAVQKHYQWVSYFWPKEDKAAYLQLVQMYLEDERFKQYYDQHAQGLTAFLCKIVEIHLV